MPSIAPERLPGLNESGQADPYSLLNDPLAGLDYGAPDFFGDPQPDFASQLPSDLYPENSEEHDKLLKWCIAAFDAAETARREYDNRWQRYYRLYRSHVERKPGDWHSTVFVPMAFWIIETVTPRLVAQLPKFICNPVGPEDVPTAQNMEEQLDYAVQQSGLYEELVKGFKSSLKYGTGILKTFHRQDMRRGRKIMPIDAPLNQTVTEYVYDEFGQPVLDLDGHPITEDREVEIGRMPMGQQAQTFNYVAYDGPASECIDIFNFWVAPEAHDIDSARYVIHRTYKDMAYIKRMVKEGIYRWPENLNAEDITDVADDPAMQRLNSIGLQSANFDATRQPVELLEFWLNDGRKIVMVNRKALLQVIENPFDHAEKPFIRIVNYLQEHEFWGVGEIEPIEGLQDVQNALVNSRIDNLRLLLNAMFTVNVHQIEDMRDLRMRPGGIIRTKGDFRPDEVIQRVDLGDVTAGAFNETEAIDRAVEKTSGISGYQMGMDSPSSNDTATGVAIIQEQGASRFGLKSKLIELMGMKRLGRQYGSIIQQFTSEEKMVRMFGPQGQVLFKRVQPSDLQGALDYDIEAESTTQSQTMKQEAKMNLLGLVAQFAPQGVMAALSDVLDAFGVKDKERFLFGDPTMMDPNMMGMNPGMGGDPNAMQPGMDPGMQGELPPGGGAETGDPYGADPYAGQNPAQGTPGDQMAEQMLAQLAANYNQEAQL